MLPISKSKYHNWNLRRVKRTKKLIIHRKDIHELAEKANLLDNSIITFEKELDELNEKKRAFDENISEYEKELDSFEDKFNSYVDAQNQRKLELERLKGQIENTRSSITRSLSNQKINLKRN